jgi:hypothetical protein
MNRIIATTLRLLTALLLALLAAFMRTGASAADSPLPVFVCVGGGNMSGGRSRIEDLPQELEGEQADALFFDGTQWTRLSPEKINGRGFGAEVSFDRSLTPSGGVFQAANSVIRAG